MDVAVQLGRDAVAVVAARGLREVRIRSRRTTQRQEPATARHQALRRRRARRAPAHSACTLLPVTLPDMPYDAMRLVLTRGRRGGVRRADALRARQAARAAGKARLGEHVPHGALHPRRRLREREPRPHARHAEVGRAVADGRRHRHADRRGCAARRDEPHRTPGGHPAERLPRLTATDHPGVAHLPRRTLSGSEAAGGGEGVAGRDRLSSQASGGEGLSASPP